ncbi:GGDEF domain-containing protein [Ectothiorhodospiraceae bacterium BW-2]|nr:GGDEF domain-containing protein [Ectothiorhodospiraceae bacterium BW-2]
MSSPPDWKARYLDALDHIEQLERQWQTLQTTTRRGFASIAAAIPHSGGYRLNQRLHELGLNLTPDNSAERLETLFNETVSNIGPAQQASQKKPSQRQDLVQQLLAMLEQWHLPVEYQGYLKQSRTALERLSGDTPAMEETALHLFDELLQKIFRHLQAQEQQQTPIGSLPSIKQILLELINYTLSDAKQQQLFYRRLESIREQSSLHKLIEDLATTIQLNIPGTLAPNEILIRLLERLDIPLGLHDELEEIKQRLQQGTLGSDNLETILKAIADLIQAMRHREQQEKSELECFLQQLTGYLSDIDNHIRAHLEFNQQSREVDGQLQRDMEKNVSQLADHVANASNLPELKQSISHYLQQLRDRMEQFTDTEEARLQQAETQITQLTTQLQQVQQESLQLKEEVRNHLQIALIDPLTGIPNRLAYNERIEQELSRTVRYQHPLCMAVWDIDHFKRVNDNYGHLAGDKVLTVIAKLLRRHIRKSDFVARFGGEEFILLLPETTLDAAIKVVEGLRKRIEKTEFRFRNQRVPITSSCGIAEFTAEDTLETLFRRADDALYLAKKGGRNRCCHQYQLPANQS